MKLPSCRMCYKPGWRCTRYFIHEGSCALVPSWWNLKWRWKTRG